MPNKIIPINNDRSYYCSNKFTFLKIDLEKSNTYNCHAATPHSIDFEWLQKNPTELFNTPINVAERELMLDNHRNASCEQNCYPAEDRGQVSTRILVQSNCNHRYTETKSQPSEVDLTLFSDCNLTCSYCCKEYSSSWRQDLLKNGSYVLPKYADKSRMSLLPIDIVSGKVSQTEKKSSSKIKMLLDYCYSIQENVKVLTITGGEPFLNNQLPTVLEKFKTIPQINLYSGLGVNTDRLRRILTTVAQYKNITLIISAESTDKNYEFNRYGMTWSQFQERLQVVQDLKINYTFQCTISNLTVLGFKNFYKLYKNSKMFIQFVHHPDFMSAGNLDPTSKQQVIDELLPYQHDKKIQQILQTVGSTYVNNDHRLTMAAWIKQFADRRGLNLNTYPKTFLEWLNQ
jgi:organic radical activating enzyme